MRVLRTAGMVAASLTTLAVWAIAWPIVRGLIRNRLEAARGHRH